MTNNKSIGIHTTFLNVLLNVYLSASNQHPGAVASIMDTVLIFRKPNFWKKLMDDWFSALMCTKGR